MSVPRTDTSVVGTRTTARNRGEVAPFFDGLELVARGLVPLSQWWSNGPGRH